MTYEEEIKRLNRRLDEKNEALHRATEQIVSMKGDCNYYIDRTNQLKAEKMDLIRLLNQRSQTVNMRSDQNWDSRPMAERIKMGRLMKDE